MSPEERALFVAFLTNSDAYAEFGSGGSTFVASELVHRRIVSLESDRAWLDRVSAICAERPHLVQPQLVHVDVGPTGAWGYPTDPMTRDLWPDYADRLWAVEAVAQSDTFLIDGRFRVACFLETALRCRADAVILFHDFGSRSHYHIVGEVARPIATAADLTAFVRRPDFDPAHAARLLKTFRFNPA
jgi:hypothetical protein